MNRRMFGWLGGSLLMAGCPADPADTTLETASEGDPSSSTDPGSTTAPDLSTGPQDPTTSGSTTVDPSTGGTSTTDSTTDPLTGGSTIDPSTGDATTDPSTGGSTTDPSSSGSTGDGSSTGDPVCGDGQVGGPEECDDGAMSAECDVDCTAVMCGDGVLNDLAGEVCDDSNSVGGDACSPTCLVNPEVKQIALGSRHSCALLEDGTMRCWGTGPSGALGYGNPDILGDQPGELPTPSVPVGGPVVRACASVDHTCALLDGGTVRCWGSNELGVVLGIGDADDHVGDSPGDMPPADVDVGAPVKDITCGSLHTCVLTQDDNVRCWGLNSHGQLGYGHKNDLGDDPGDFPLADVELGGPVVQVAADDSHTCAILQDGTLRCWGTNAKGQLGYGHTNDLGDQPGEMPPPPVDIGGPALQVEISNTLPNTCVLLTSGEVRCWGQNMYDILGQPFPGQSSVADEPGEMPTPALALAGKAVAISIAAASGCAMLEDGALQCWGYNLHGAVGVPGDVQVEAPTLIDIGGPAVRMASGNSHHCAVLTDGTLRCWGRGLGARLGLGHEDNIGDDEAPVSAGPVPY